jgi:hypothetical protein
MTPRQSGEVAACAIHSVQTSARRAKLNEHEEGTVRIDYVVTESDVKRGIADVQVLWNSDTGHPTISCSVETETGNANVTITKVKPDGFIARVWFASPFPVGHKITIHALAS